MSIWWNNLPIYLIPRSSTYASYKGFARTLVLSVYFMRLVFFLRSCSFAIIIVNNKNVYRSTENCIYKRDKVCVYWIMVCEFRWAGRPFARRNNRLRFVRSDSVCYKWLYYVYVEGLRETYCTMYANIMWIKGGGTLFEVGFRATLLHKNVYTPYATYGNCDDAASQGRFSE